mmetsp:Transcript_11109/g.16243  ORF Transcript_11109/g.16243 Transcript_11109/m.16243 type:complete len:785 (-) Transcript_11109:179-2533(-)
MSWLPIISGAFVALSLSSITMIITFIVPSVTAFNYEIGQRFIDRLSYYMDVPMATNLLISNFRFAGGFPNGLLAPDRDQYLRLRNALAPPMVYYGLEDGSISGFYKGGEFNFGYYREPGNGGYALDDPKMAKHLASCVEKNGTQKDCIMDIGSQYTKCVDECKVQLCPDEDSQKNCSSLMSDEDRSACDGKKRYCAQYEIAYAPLDPSERLGYVPLTNFCHDVRGLFTQVEGEVLQSYFPITIDLGTTSQSSFPLGNCYHADGTTRVNRSLAGAYGYCGTNGEVCNNTFAGGYESSDYDPRYRPWYTAVRESQAPTWFGPYPYFMLGLGLTFGSPIYDDVDGKRVFAGVLAVDYRLEDIAKFLVDTYGGTDTAVIMYDEASPNYVVASSTGSPAAKLVLKEDPSKPCPVSSGTMADTPCDPARVKVSEFSTMSGNEMDNMLVKASLRHIESSYPEELISIKAPSEIRFDVYLSQNTLFEHPGTNLQWRVIIISPGNRSASDSIEANHPLFGTIITVGLLGVIICLAFFIAFYRSRKQRAVIYADWRFTCAFILGCALFNCSTFAFLGPNTDMTCMMRMWVFHLFFVVALAPLFVKVWRMSKLAGSSNIRRQSVSHTKTALLMLPLLLAQTIILTFVSIFDPPHQTQNTEVVAGIVTQHIVCSQNTMALFITEIVFEAGLIVIGCYLAFKTRNMNDNFGESKQLIFAMYNIALVSVVFLLLSILADLEQGDKKMLQAVGVFWGTTVSSAAFVIPRLIQVQNFTSGSNVALSGIGSPATKFGSSQN